MVCAVAAFIETVVKRGNSTWRKVVCQSNGVVSITTDLAGQRNLVTHPAGCTYAVSVDCYL